MPNPIGPGAEPIPGYRVVERLGAGGYGEVWRVTAPGDVPKALKVVFGGLGLHAEQEQKSLERIKAVRHPFLLSLERFEVLQNQLLIITELADKSLLDRYLECHAAGLPGIPRDELLGYMRDAAEALDYMSATHGLQHQDVKPQNLLLLAGRVKVADFGLVKELVGTRVTATGGATPVYAPPEAYDGWISRFSDQYSLAIVFQEMLTGVRPFPGTTALQLARQHTSARPMLDPLPPLDRPVVGRALAKVPDQRFPSSREFVNALLDAPAAPLPPVARPAVPAPANASQLLREHTSIGEAGPKTLVMGGGLPRVETPVEGEDETPLPERTGPRPTLVLGVGGLAGSVLRRLSRRRAERTGSRAALPTFRMLLLDTDPATMKRSRQVTDTGALSMEESLHTPLHPPEHYRPQARALLRWLDRRWLYGIPRSLLTEGLRPLGRLALVDNAVPVLERVREALVQVTAPESRAASVETTGLPMRDEAPRIFLVASTTGGTSGGMVVGLAYAVRQVLAELHLSADGICGVLLHATSQKPAEQGLARANAHATLREVAHFSRSEVTYPGDSAEGLKPGPPGTPPFSDCYLVHLGDGLSAEGSDNAADAIAEYLHLDADTGGPYFDRFRQDSRPSPESTPAGTALRGLGLARVGFPRQRLAAAAATVLCRRLVELWPGPTDDAVRTRAEGDAGKWLADLKMDEESLVGRCSDEATGVFGESPETYFRGILAPLTAGSAQGPADATRLLEQVDTLLGTGPVPGLAGPDPAPTPVETELRGRGRFVGSELARSLLDGLLGLVETPGSRLAAAAAAAAWLTKEVQHLADSIRARLTNQLRPHRHSLHLRLAGGKGSGPKGSSGWLRIARWKGDAADGTRQVLEYCWVRLGEIALENALEAIALVEKLLTQFAKEAAAARQVVTKWAQGFRPSAKGPGDPDSGVASRHLLPGKAKNLEQAAAVLCNGLAPPALHEFDERFQAEVLAPFGGLWKLSVEPRPGDPDPAADQVWLDLESRARDAVMRLLDDVNAARLFLEMCPDVEQAQGALAARLRAATPKPETSGGWQRLVLGLPKGEAGDTLKDMVGEIMQGVPLTLIPSPDDVLICFEAANIPLLQVAVALGGREVPEELKDQVLTRTDITWSPLKPGAI